MPDTLLSQLRAMTTIVADSGDFDAIQRFKPKDGTTNPSLLAAAARMPQYDALVGELLSQASRELGRQALPKDVVDLTFRRLGVAFGLKILALVPGRVSTEVDARLSYDREATIRQAHDIIAQYQAAGISNKRVLIKIAATWEGIQAAKALEIEGIHCNLTLVFGLHQAAACAEAGVTLISPFVGRILDWHIKASGGTYVGAEDPGVQSLARIYYYMKQFGFRTAVMGASFRSVEQIKQVAGCDLLTISPKLLAELDAASGNLTRMLWAQDAKDFPLPRLSLDQEQFERLHQSDTMASELLSQGIEGFSRSLAELESLLAERLKTQEPR